MRKYNSFGSEIVEDIQSCYATKYPKVVSAPVYWISLGEFGPTALLRAIGQVSDIACADQYGMNIITGSP